MVPQNEFKLISFSIFFPLQVFVFLCGAFCALLSSCALDSRLKNVVFVVRYVILLFQKIKLKTRTKNKTKKSFIFSI